MQTKVISCNSANKSCIFQVVHTKAIAALTQFCDFLKKTCYSVTAWSHNFDCNHSLLPKRLNIDIIVASSRCRPTITLSLPPKTCWWKNISILVLIIQFHTFNDSIEKSILSLLVQGADQRYYRCHQKHVDEKHFNLVLIIQFQYHCWYQN